MVLPSSYAPWLNCRLYMHCLQGEGKLGARAASSRGGLFMAQDPSL